MSSVPVLMSNGWLAGTVTPDACSSGVSPDFYNESTGQVFVCAANAYVPITGSGSPGQPQSPWLSDIDGGGFGLFNAKSLGIGLGFAPTGVGNVFIGGADSSSPAIVSLLNNSFNGLNMFMNGTTGAPAGPTFFGNAQITSDTNLFLGASGHPGQVTLRNTGFVGINNTSPAFALDVTGDINLTGQIRIGGTPVALGQTPWAQDIQGAGFQLNNVGAIGVNTIANFPTSMMAIALPAGLPEAIQVTNADSTITSNIAMFNDAFNSMVIGVNGTATGFQPGTGQIISTNRMFFQAQGSVMMYISSVGIGLGNIPTPAHLLQLAADDAAKPATNTWTVASDERLKQGSQLYTKSLDVVRQLTPKMAVYNGEDGTPRGVEVIGLNAQDLLPLEPSWVNSRRGVIAGEETDVLYVDSGPLIFMLTNAIKELDARLAIAESKLV